jgi:UV DNA damage endonuclease
MKLGLCCISLNLQERDPPLKFQKMTKTRFLVLPKDEARTILGERILNNIVVTDEAIKYCAENDYCYRVSSDLFPLITCDEVSTPLSDLPNYEQIEQSFDRLKNTVLTSGVRISAHPSEYNVLASTNTAAVDKTIQELNFYSRFFDRIGCEASHVNPMNLHINNRAGSNDEVIDRFLSNFEKLDDNCKSRLVVENDDKLNCWSVRQLMEFHEKTRLPITFDYLHHACHPENMTEEEAIKVCFDTWDTKPLFHYSESKEGNNPRAHADYAINKFDTYGLDFDCDFELKAKDKAIQKYTEQFAESSLLKEKTYVCS